MSGESREASALPAALGRLVLGAYFHRLEVVGMDRVPTNVPVLFVANHNNSLVDPILVLGLLPRKARFLGKSTLWEVPLLRPLLDWGGVIPVYRRQDEGVDPSRNEETFARCFEVLGAGGAIAIFPEGKSHDEPALAPLRTGAARIAIGAERRFGPLGVEIVPIGLLFDDKQRFRSQALVVVGEPIELWPEEGVRALTARIERSLREVSHDWPSWEEARLVGLAGSIASLPESDPLPESAPLEQSFQRAKLFQKGVRELECLDPQRLEPLRISLRRYDRTLRFFDLRDDQVAARYEPRSILRYLVLTMARLLLRLPFAIVGILLSWIPYLVCDLAARRYADAPDEVATYKIYSGLIAYPAAWSLEAIAVGLAFGTSWGLLTAVTAPVSSYLTLDYRDRRQALLRETRALFRVRREQLGERLRAQRREVAEQIEGAIEAYRELSLNS